METSITFPRDINNLIVKKMDIDTRIKSGIFLKLKIPKAIEEKISKIIKPTTKKYGNETETSLNLGPNRLVLGLSHPVYYLVKIFDKQMNFIEYRILNATINPETGRAHPFITVSSVDI